MALSHDTQSVHGRMGSFDHARGPQRAWTLHKKHVLSTDLDVLRAWNRGSLPENLTVMVEVRDDNGTAGSGPAGTLHGPYTARLAQYSNHYEWVGCKQLQPKSDRIMWNGGMYCSASGAVVVVVHEGQQRPYGPAVKDRHADAPEVAITDVEALFGRDVRLPVAVDMALEVDNGPQHLSAVPVHFVALSTRKAQVQHLSEAAKQWNDINLSSLYCCGYRLERQAAPGLRPLVVKMVSTEPAPAYPPAAVATGTAHAASVQAGAGGAGASNTQGPSRQPERHASGGVELQPQGGSGEDGTQKKRSKPRQGVAVAQGAGLAGSGASGSGTRGDGSGNLSKPHAAAQALVLRSRKTGQITKAQQNVNNVKEALAAAMLEVAQEGTCVRVDASPAGEAASPPSTHGPAHAEPQTCAPSVSQEECAAALLSMRAHGDACEVQAAQVTCIRHKQQDGHQGRAHGELEQRHSKEAHALMQEHSGPAAAAPSGSHLVARSREIVQHVASPDGQRQAAVKNGWYAIGPSSRTEPGAVSGDACEAGCVREDHDAAPAAGAEKDVTCARPTAQKRKGPKAKDEQTWGNRNVRPRTQWVCSNDSGGSGQRPISASDGLGWGAPGGEAWVVLDSSSVPHAPAGAWDEEVVGHTSVCSSAGGDAHRSLRVAVRNVEARDAAVATAGPPITRTAHRARVHVMEAAAAATNAPGSGCDTAAAGTAANQQQTKGWMGVAAPVQQQQQAPSTGDEGGVVRTCSMGSLKVSACQRGVSADTHTRTCEDENTPCMLCSSPECGTPGQVILLCGNNVCKRGAHVSCLELPSVPLVEWFCNLKCEGAWLAGCVTRGLLDMTCAAAHLANARRHYSRPPLVPGRSRYDACQLHC